MFPSSRLGPPRSRLNAGLVGEAGQGEVGAGVGAAGAEVEVAGVATGAEARAAAVTAGTEAVEVVERLGEGMGVEIRLSVKLPL
eukprot:CAMPEP_0173247456 /NCGR_PEP_ID=MMETSP1142-20121109/17905_1 /TAXON_ID=483371 /ORGANISM="non described non described, Strain CCMP2298" /LENGTH=83 /DNA_ID=CAMNT_0014179837 /DNA_START=128 /DNA_END=379 /DNA_ORIENTATION=-